MRFVFVCFFCCCAMNKFENQTNYRRQNENYLLFLYCIAVLMSVLFVLGVTFPCFKFGYGLMKNFYTTSAQPNHRSHFCKIHAPLWVWIAKNQEKWNQKKQFEQKKHLSWQEKIVFDLCITCWFPNKSHDFRFFSFLSLQTLKIQFKL